MQFEFDQELKAQNNIEIDDIGFFGLEASNSEGYYYYLVIRSIMGTSIIATCGPVIPDLDALPSGFKMTLDKMPYKEDKLIKTISYFLNDKSKKITDAKVMEVNEAINEFRELKEYLLNFSEGSY